MGLEITERHYDHAYIKEMYQKAKPLATKLKEGRSLYGTNEQQILTHVGWTGAEKVPAYYNYFIKETDGEWDGKSLRDPDTRDEFKIYEGDKDEQFTADVVKSYLNANSKTDYKTVARSLMACYSVRKPLIFTVYGDGGNNEENKLIKELATILDATALRLKDFTVRHITVLNSENMRCSFVLKGKEIVIYDRSKTTKGNIDIACQIADRTLEKSLIDGSTLGKQQSWNATQCQQIDDTTYRELTFVLTKIETQSGKNETWDSFKTRTIDEDIKVGEQTYAKNTTYDDIIRDLFKTHERTLPDDDNGDSQKPLPNSGSANTGSSGSFNGQQNTTGFGAQQQPFGQQNNPGFGFNTQPQQQNFSNPNTGNFGGFNSYNSNNYQPQPNNQGLGFGAQQQQPPINQAFGFNMQPQQQDLSNNYTGNNYQQPQNNPGNFGQQNNTVFGGGGYDNNSGGFNNTGNFGGFNTQQQQPPINQGFGFNMQPQQQDLNNNYTGNFGGGFNNSGGNFNTQQQFNQDLGFGAQPPQQQFDQQSNPGLGGNPFNQGTMYGGQGSLDMQQQPNNQGCFGQLGQQNNQGLGGFPPQQQQFGNTYTGSNYQQPQKPPPNKKGTSNMQAQQQNSLTLQEAEQLIRDLPVLLEKSVFETKSIDPATLGEKIATLSGHKGKKLWKNTDTPIHGETTYALTKNLADFAKEYAEKRLKGESTTHTLGELILQKAIPAYIADNQIKNAEELKINDDNLKKYEQTNGALDAAIAAHDSYIDNEIQNDFAFSVPSQINLLPKERVDAGTFKTTIDTNFKGIEWPIIYVQDGKLFKLECGKFQSFLENGNYPEFPTAFIALLYQLKKRTFIFTSSDGNVISHFRKIAAQYSNLLYNTNSESRNKLCEADYKPEIKKIAIDFMVQIRMPSVSDTFSAIKCYYRKSDKSKEHEISIEKLHDYYKHTNNVHITVERFVAYLGALAFEYHTRQNNPTTYTNSVTLTGSPDSIYEQYKYLEGILTDDDKKKIEPPKVNLSKSKGTGDDTKKNDKDTAVDSILTNALTRFKKIKGNGIDEKNLAKKGFGRKFFKTVEENVEINGLNDLIDAIYTTTGFKNSIFNTVKKISDLEKIVNEHITSDDIGLSAKGLCLMGTTYAYADYCYGDKNHHKAKDIVDKLPKTIKSLDRTGLRKTTLTNHVKSISALNNIVTKTYWTE